MDKQERLATVVYQHIGHGWDRPGLGASIMNSDVVREMLVEAEARGFARGTKEACKAIAEAEHP